MGGCVGGLCEADIDECGNDAGDDESVVVVAVRMIVVAATVAMTVVALITTIAMTMLTKLIIFLVILLMILVMIMFMVILLTVLLMFKWTLLHRITLGKAHRDTLLVKLTTVSMMIFLKNLRVPRMVWRMASLPKLNDYKETYPRRLSVATQLSYPHTSACRKQF